MPYSTRRVDFAQLFEGGFTLFNDFLSEDNLDHRASRSIARSSQRFAEIGSIFEPFNDLHDLHVLNDFELLAAAGFVEACGSEREDVKAGLVAVMSFS